MHLIPQALFAASHYPLSQNTHKDTARASLLLSCLLGNSCFLSHSPPHADGHSSHSEHGQHAQQDEGPGEPRAGSCQRERLVVYLGPLSQL